MNWFGRVSEGMKEWNRNGEWGEWREDTTGLYNEDAQVDGSSPGMLNKISSVLSCLLQGMEMELWQ